MIVCIKERSLIAIIAAKFLYEKRMAVVLGNTIHLWNTTKHDFISNQKWLQHELVHVRQFKDHGFAKFLLLYLLESVKHGYHNNKFEIEAQEEQNKKSIFHYLIN